MIDPLAIGNVLAYILPAIASHRATSTAPFILGLSGLQGSGKSTWATALAKTLNDNHNITTRTLSLDDLYHDHPQLVALREAHPDNGLLRTRGQPGTHDEELARQFFHDLAIPEVTNGTTKSTNKIRWPSFDKSLHNGEGGRTPLSEWDEVSRSPPLDVLIFEGWCVGFQPLNSTVLEQKWRAAQDTSARSDDRKHTDISTETLADHQLEDLLLINKNLERYCQAFMGPWRFDAFVHLNTDNLVNVYHWRLGQEKALWKAKGRGMTDEQVILFVRGYMPAYELYLDDLSKGNLFQGDHEAERKAHVQVLLDESRGVKLVGRL